MLAGEWAGDRQGRVVNDKLIAGSVSLLFILRSRASSIPIISPMHRPWHYSW